MIELNCNCFQNITPDSCVCFGDGESTSDPHVYVSRDDSIVILNAHKLKDEKLYYEETLKETVSFEVVQGKEELLLAAYSGVLDNYLEDEKKDPTGSPLSKVFRKEVFHFFNPLCVETITGRKGKGAWLCLIMMWSSNLYLLRTFPILSYKKRVLGCKVVILPYTSTFQSDVNRFSLHSRESSGDTSTIVSLGQDPPRMKMTLEAILEDTKD